MASKTIENIDYDKLPEPIVKSLRELIARIKLILWIRGGLAVVAVVVVAVLLVMGIDAMTIIISPIYRWGLSSLVLLACALACYFYLYRPLSQPFTLTRVARFVELRHPELQERMSSIIELCRIDEKENNFGSKRLINKLAEEATFDAGKVKPRQEINAESVKPWFIAAGCVVAFILILSAIWPLRTLRLMARVIVPSADIGSFFSDTITVSPGNSRIVVGSPLTITVKTDNSKIDHAYMIKFADDGKLIKERMVRQTLDPENENKNLKVFIIEMPQVNKSFSYCIHAGHSVTEKYEIFAEEPPHIDRIDMTYHYPKYTGLGSVLKTNTTGNINVLNGTEVHVSLELSKPISDAEVIVAGNKLSETNISYLSQVQMKCRFLPPVNIENKWEIRLKDHFGFKNAPKTYEVVSVQDLAPRVDVYRPINKELTLSPDSRFVINYFAFDDYGLTNAFLEITKNADAPFVYPLKKLVKEKDKEGMWSGSIRFDMSKFDLKNTTSLSLQVCVSDALPVELGGPQIAKSEPIVVTIDKTAESLARQSYEMQHDTIKSSLENILKRLEDAVNDTKAMNLIIASETPDYVTVDENASEIAKDMSIVNELLENLTDLLKETAYHKLIDGVRVLQTKGIDKARGHAEMIVMLPKNEKKNEGKQLRIALEDSILMLKNLFVKLEKLDDIVEAWLKTEELADKQEMLSENLADMVEEGDIPNEEWVDEQQSIADELAEALAEQNPETIKNKLAEAQELSEKLAKDAENLADIQKKLASATSEQDIKKLENALEEAIKNNNDSEYLEKVKEALVEEDFDEAMASVQKAVDDSAGALAEGVQELEAVSDILSENEELKQITQNAANLADQAENNTQNALEMAENIAQQQNEADMEQKNLMQNVQDKAAESLDQVSQELQKTFDAFQKQVTAMEENLQEMSPSEPSNIEDAMMSAMKAALAAKQAMNLAESMDNPAEQFEAAQEALKAQQNAIAAQQDAQAAQQEALDAQKKALEAMNNDPLSEIALQAQKTADDAQAKAEAAQKAALQAMEDAKDAMDAQGELSESVAAAEAQAKAAEAQKRANQAQEDASKAQDEAHSALNEAASNPSPENAEAAKKAQEDAMEAQNMATQAQNEANQNQVMAAQNQQNAIASLQKNIEQQEAMQAAVQALNEAQQTAQALNQMMQQKAEQLGMNQQQMQTMASMNQPTPPSQQSDQSSNQAADNPSQNPQNSPKKVEAGVIDPELLKNLGLTLEDWEKIKGELKSGVTSEGAYDNIPPEYRALVREYFREIATQVETN